MGIWRRLGRRRRRIARQEAGAELLANLINAVVFWLALCFGVVLAMRGRIEIGAAAALCFAIQSFQEGFWNFTWAVAVSAWDLRHVGDLFAFTRLPREAAERGAPVP